jgi:hypothetical protein
VQPQHNKRTKKRILAGEVQGAWTHKDLKPLEVARVNLLTRGKESLASKN